MLLPVAFLSWSCTPVSTQTRPAKIQAQVKAYDFEGSYDLFGGLKVNAYGFNNGLKLLVVQDPASPTVAYQTWFGVGSAMEASGSTGLAHLFEHMMFKQTEDYENGHFNEALDAVGAEGVNAWTWVDETVYIQKVPKGALATVAELEATRMQRLVIDAEAFDTERDVVISERRLRIDSNPNNLVDEALFSTAYGAHPYGNPTGGWMADLEAMTVESAQAFYNDWYAPNNATVVIVGDVQPEVAANTVMAAYARVQSKAVPDRTHPGLPEQTEQERVEVDTNSAVDRLQVVFSGPPYRDPDALVLQVIQASLTAGQSGLLIRALQGSGLATRVHGDVLSLRLTSPLQFAVTATPGTRAETIEEVFWEQMAQVAENGLDPDALERAKNQVLGQQWRWLDTNGGKAWLLGMGVITGDGDWTFHRDRLENIKAVSAEDVQRVAAALLQPDNATVAIGRGSGETVRRRVPALTPSTQSPAPIKARSFGGPPSAGRGALVEETAHGAQVLTLYEPTVPLAHLRMAFPRGSALDGGKAGLTHLTASAVLRGTETRGRAAFEEAAEALGAQVDVAVDADAVIFSASVPKDGLPALIALLSEAITKPGFETKEIKQLKDEVQNELRATLDNDWALVRAAHRRTVYGAEHPYGAAPLGSLKTVSGLSAKDVAAHHPKVFHADGAILLAAGHIDEGTAGDLKRLAAMLPKDAFTKPSWPSPEWTFAEPADVADGEEAPQHEVLLVDKPGASQAHIILGQLGVVGNEDHYPGFWLVNEVLGGRRKASRLMQELRVKRGLTYGASAKAQPRPHVGDVAIHAFPAVDKAGETAQLMLEMVEKIDAEGIHGQDFAEMRDASKLRAVFLEETLGKRIDLVLDQKITGFHPQDRVDALDGWQLQDINAAYQQVMQPHAMVVTVVGPADVLKEPLSALGPVHVISHHELIE